MTGPLPGAPLVMKARLGELDGHWLYMRCACGRSCALPFRLLIGQHGPNPYLGAIVPRLTCRSCRARPVSLHLNERGDTGAHGGAGGSWSIPLPLPGAPG